MTPTLGLGAWYGVTDRDPRLVGLYQRHYSAAKNGVGLASHLKHGFAGLCDPMCLLTETCDAGWVWGIESLRLDGQIGVQCRFFRNEGPLLSSGLIREADDLAWGKWPSEARHWTYVDPKRTRHKRDPGRCFLKAGWRRCGKSKGGLVILEKVR